MEKQSNQSCERALRTRTCHLTVPAVLLLQVLVINVFCHSNCEPGSHGRLYQIHITVTAAERIETDCPSHWPHLMARINVIRWARSIILRTAQCIMTDLLARFNGNGSTMCGTQGSKRSQGLEVSPDELVGAREGGEENAERERGTA